MAMVKTDSKHYSDIAQAIRTKSGSSGQYKPQEMPAAILGLETGGSQSTILVYADTGSSITLSCGDVVRTAPENNGLWRFDNCGLGTWVVSATKDDLHYEEVVEIKEEEQRIRYEVRVVYIAVFGIARDVTSSSPAWTRTDDAVGKTAKGSVGTAAGYSDFDLVYPWKEIQRETVSTGDVMVKIPKFWYQRYREGNMEYIKIAGKPKEGFKLHPAFCHGGVERDALYVGAYKTSTGAMSASGETVRTATSIGSCRTNAKNKGAGWGITDLAAVSAIQMLFLVEYASFNSQAALASGYTAGSSSGSRMATGSTDSVPNLTGSPAGTDGMVDVVWRGMEGLWGNVYEYIDGVIVDTTNQKYYVCKDPKNYGEEITAHYKELAYALPGKSLSSKYITKLGLEAGEWDFVMLPEAAGTGSASTYICDVMSTTSSGNTVIRRGGRWYSDDYAGLFMYDSLASTTNTNSQNASRLMLIPQEVA